MIETLMGLALGCVGMSMDDFCRLTPFEFKKVWEQWQAMRENSERSEWQRTRMTCLYILQPYSKKRLKPSDVMTFPWEQKKRKSEMPSRREIQKRFERIKKERGLV